MARTTHTIKTRVLTEGNLQGMTVDKVGQLLGATDPGKVMDVGAEYQALAKRLDTTVRELEKHSKALAEAWHGDAAVKAQEALRKLHATARELRAKSNQMGGSLANLGKQMDWYQVHRPGYGNTSVDDSLKSTVGLDNADDDAKAHLRNLNSRMRQAHGAMPASVTEDLPQLAKQADKGPPGGRTPSSTNPHGKDPFGKNPYDNKDPFGKDPLGNDPSTKDPYGNDPYGNDPYGKDPSGGGRDPFGNGGTELASAGGGGLGGGGGGLGTGGGLGGGGGGVGGGPGGGLGSAGGLAGGPLGAGAAGAGRGGLGSGAKSGAAGRPGGTPLGGGGGGKDGEKERERSTWLTEDEDVWGDDGDVAPPVIG